MEENAFTYVIPIITIVISRRNSSDEEVRNGEDRRYDRKYHVSNDLQTRSRVQH